MTSQNYILGLIRDGKSISTDSRQIPKDAIFFALRGDNFDGNRYAQVALENGASIAVVDNIELEGTPNIIVVPNTLLFLQEIATLYRKELKIPVIGLTGSNGKTTTKELISCVLQKKYSTFSTKGNLNNHIGVPISILSIQQNHEMAIIEMGANHIGEIEQLCTIAQPTHGLITNIGKAHLEGFGSIEGVKKGKSELYKHIANSKGTIFVNDKNRTLEELASKFNFSNQINFGKINYTVETVNQDSPTLQFKVKIDNESFGIKSQLIGEYNIENIIAAICIGNYFDVSHTDSIDAIENYTPSNSRSQLLETKKNTLILDAYNANPSSMELALKNFSLLPSTNPKIVILGEMLEMGDFAVQEHTRIASLAGKEFKNVFLVGANFYGLSDSSKWFANQAECANYLKENPIEGYTILLKGSRGVKLEGLLDYL